MLARSCERQANSGNDSPIGDIRPQEGEDEPNTKGNTRMERNGNLSSAVSNKLALAENVMLELTPSEMNGVAGGMLPNTSTLTSVTVTVTVTESSAVCTTILTTL